MSGGPIDAATLTPNTSASVAHWPCGITRRIHGVADGANGLTAITIVITFAHWGGSIRGGVSLVVNVGQ